MTTANPFISCTPPAWATAFGQDKYGYFADFRLEAASDESGFVSHRMRWIPAGSFFMGAPEDEIGRNKGETQHLVNLTRGFWLGESTCTQKMWEAVTEENPSHFRGDTLPVDSVSYEDVQQFLDLVNERVPHLDLNLPTESQWEYACRAGSEDPFSFGAEISTDQANFDGNYPYREGDQGEYRQKTIPACSLLPNPWGLFQMHGNVWEWCQDWLGDYPCSKLVNPLGPDSGVYRVMRGGSCYDVARDVRAAYRDGNYPDARDDNLGFRCMSSVRGTSE